MAYPPLFGPRYPQTILEEFSGTFVLGEKKRVFVVRKVFYNEDNKPDYSLGSMTEVEYLSLEELKKNNKRYSSLQDKTVLDKDNKLKPYKDDLR
jgi:hypothetical protein